MAVNDKVPCIMYPCDAGFPEHLLQVVQKLLPIVQQSHSTAGSPDRKLIATLHHLIRMASVLLRLWSINYRFLPDGKLTGSALAVSLEPVASLALALLQLPSTVTVSGLGNVDVSSSSENGTSADDSASTGMAHGINPVHTDRSLRFWELYCSCSCQLSYTILEAFFEECRCLIDNGDLSAARATYASEEVQKLLFVGVAAATAELQRRQWPLGDKAQVSRAEKAVAIPTEQQQHVYMQLLNVLGVRASFREVWAAFTDAQLDLNHGSLVFYEMTSFVFNMYHDSLKQQQQ